QTVEKTALLIGNAEKASHNVPNGFQGSLRGQLESLLEFGLSEEQKSTLMNLGYTEDTINKMMKSLAYYNDFYYHASRGFTPEQRQWFYSIGLTDAQISELQTRIHDHYTQVYTREEGIKQQQTELLYIQLNLSAAALGILVDQEERGRDKPDESENAEEKLLEAIQTVSEDRSSLEKVKAYSKQVYKAAEQKIRKGEEQYMVNYFVGLQIHCGAVTALNGDREFGLTRIQSYGDILSDYANGRLILLPEQSSPGEETSSDTVTVSGFVGQVEESNEDNNTGYIILIIKTRKTTAAEILQMLAQMTAPEFVKLVIEKLLGLGTAAKAVLSVGGTIFVLIIEAEPIGGGWVECVVSCTTTDPSGIFIEIFEDKETVATIETKAFDLSLEDCEREGYKELYLDPMQIVYTIMLAMEIYRSPDNHYFYYMVDNSDDEWVVEVEVLGHVGCGRVVEAYRVDCTYECNDISCSILEKWILYDNFVRVWSRSIADSFFEGVAQFL
ncbi:MAG: hypothetical protein HXS44_11390, partial [Theionarchaea archaeon]|nr:hypothetical protein [Theionarchaea archaeon]